MGTVPQWDVGQDTQTCRRPSSGLRPQNGRCRAKELQVLKIEVPRLARYLGRYQGKYLGRYQAITARQVLVRAPLPSRLLTGLPALSLAILAQLSCGS